MSKIGIWGFGVVGKSVLRFIAAQEPDSKVEIWDKKEQLKNVRSGDSLEKFLENNDKIFVSPGIDTTDYQKFSSKFVNELDIFSEKFTKPTIAITGTLGKTTITTLLGSILSKLVNNENVLVGGNVGIGMLDLIEKQENAALAILELSSFQLEHNKKFAPNIAIWTNLYPNHLDRHKTLQEYFAAKWKIVEFQNENQFLIVSQALASHPLFQARLPELKAKLIVISQDSKLTHIPDTTYKENWLFILKAIEILGFDVNFVLKNLESLAARSDELSKHSAHRLEFVKTINGSDFYNDSKSTVMEATLAALEKLNLNNKPIILIVGGVGKGVDRKPYIEKILKTKNLKRLICFGKECELLGIKDHFATLDQVLDEIYKTMHSDQILFSPGGASFDLFSNYEERGDQFKKLVAQLTAWRSSESLRAKK